MLQHYKELFALHRGSVLAGAIVAGLLALGLSVLLLEAKPQYKATVTINMQPSEEALRFNREFTGQGQFNPATIITQTHIERLLSRPVAERALELLLEQSDGESFNEEPSLLDALTTAIWSWWARLNFGYFVEPDQYKLYLDTLRRSVSVDFVEGSYILRLEATSEYPGLARRIADAYVAAYAEVASRDFLEDATDSTAVIAARIAAREAELDALLDRREDLREALGVTDVEREMNMLLSARQEALTALQDARIELLLLENELEHQIASMGPDADPQSSALQQQRRKIEDKREEVAFREQVLAGLDAELKSLGEKERRLESVNHAIEATRMELGLLRERHVGTELATRARLSPVRVISPAEEPVYPAFPKVLANTIVASVVGGLLLVVMLVLVDTAGTLVRTQFDLQTLIGTRALPSVHGRLKRLVRGGRWRDRRAREYAEALARRLTANAAEPLETILVTGFHDEAEIKAAARAIEAALKAHLAGAAQAGAISCRGLPPASTITGWSELPAGVLVVSVPPGRIERSELRQLFEAETARQRSVFMQVWS